MIYYILGGSILVTFIACLIHYFATDSDLSDFFVDNGGWVTIAMCLTVSLGIIGCIYLDLWLSLIITVTILATFIMCIYHYKDCCSLDLKDFLIEDYGWVIILAMLTLGGMTVGSVYWSLGWSLLIGLPIVISISTLSIYYDICVAYDLKDLLIDNCGWAFPFLFVSIAFTIASAILISVGHSLIIGITLVIMILSSMIHYSSEMCSGFKDFFIDEKGWLTNLIVFTIGATVFGCVYGNLATSLYIGIALLILIIACAIHYSSSSALDFEDFFIDEKGWLTISVTLLLSSSIYGFIFWSPAKTFIAISTFVALVVGALIHWNATKSKKIEDFFYHNNGFLTVSLIATVGFGIYSFAYFEIGKAITLILASLLCILCVMVHKLKARERYFVTFYALKLGALSFTLPLVIGGVINGLLYSSWAYLIVFGLLGVISFIWCLIKANLNRTLYYPPKIVKAPKPKPQPKPTSTPQPIPQPNPIPTPPVQATMHKEAEETIDLHGDNPRGKGETKLASDNQAVQLVLDEKKKK